jgi:hypothetical protein
LNQDGDDGDIPGERGSNFHSDEIFRIVETSVPVLGRQGKPPLSNHDQTDMTLLERAFKNLREVLSRRDAADIEEKPVFTENRSQVVVDTSGLAGGVFTTVADKNASLAHISAIDRTPKSRQTQCSLATLRHFR